MQANIFLIGWFFGFCCAFAILALRGTSKDLKKEKHVVRQLEYRDEIIKRQRRVIAELKKGVNK